MMNRKISRKLKKVLDSCAMPASQGRRSGYESGGGGRDTCQPREKFWREKRGATERSEPTSEGGSGGPPPGNFKNLHGKWCNLRYS